MKLSRKLKRKIKQKVLVALCLTTTVLSLLALEKKTNLSSKITMQLNMPITGADATASISDDQTTASSSDSKTTSSYSNNSETSLYSATNYSVTGTKLENTDTITYIYDAQDFVNFRDAVNAGNNYEGKTVLLMEDIDLNTVCSETIGSFVPIGATGTYFAGTFDGNYHKIKNLYINSKDYLNLGLFIQTKSTAIIKNTIMENVYVYSSYNDTKAYKYAGGIVGSNAGTIINCGINSGTVNNHKTSVNSNSSIYPSSRSGGIVGENDGIISNCYNKGTIIAYSPNTTAYNEAFAGGIVGYGDSGQIVNCYNTGSISSTSYAAYSGGIAGGNHKINSTDCLKNSYNIGSIKTNGKGYNYCSGIVGRSGWSSSYKATTISNIYCLNNVSYSHYYYNSSVSSSTSGVVASATLKTYTAKLGNAFAYDVYNTNSGYPVLAWENERPVMSLNKNQEFIKVGETLQLDVVQKEETDELVNGNYDATNFTWTSTNEDVATVNNGVVTGVSDGYTTVYAHHEESNTYAMCIINVAKEKVTPQIETGNGFTVILKADGTVWTLGNNANGALGIGSTQNKRRQVRVKIDKDTYLEDVVKITTGTAHALALTRDGKVYSWGANGNGQLGHNNTEASCYAKLVLGENGEGNLSNIVDIAAYNWTSGAIDKDGKVCVWGNGVNGTMGNNTNTSSYVPVKAEIKNAISISMGYCYVNVLTSDSSVWSWGYNEWGNLGINSTTKISVPMKTALNVTEISSSYAHNTIKKMDGKVYATGCNGHGRLSIASTANALTYTPVILPSTVNASNKVKYIKDGIKQTTLLLQDGTVWSVGNNTNGELGNGTKTNSATFVQGKTTEGILQNVSIIGRNCGSLERSNDALNTAVITKSGDIYTTGDNAYGQLGDETTTNSLYYTKMKEKVYLKYQDSPLNMKENSQYQIDKNKFTYNYEGANVYEQNKYTVQDLKYTSLNEKIATVDNNGIITTRNIKTGTTKIKVEDLTNGFITYINVVINRKQNTDTEIYIYNAEELAEFRDSVDGGNNYKDKTVYVMADIDMSTVCSNTLGSWNPIGEDGYTEGNFAGTFDGNYHTISKLYINSDEYRYNGLFRATFADTVIQNVILDNLYINATYRKAKDNLYVGGIAGYNNGTIQNCGIESGTIIAKKTLANTTADMWPSSVAGGITGEISATGKILNCYNKSSITSTSPSQEYNEAYAAGIVGVSQGGQILNCYNRGNMKATSKGAFTGGIVGSVQRNKNVANTAYIKNSYNSGSHASTATYNYSGGILGRNGWSSTWVAVTTANNYTNTNLATMATNVVSLGNAFAYDVYNINNGCPVLEWENKRPVMTLNKTQEFIKVGETLRLDVVEKEEIEELIGGNYNASNFTWTSTNEDVATVNNGIVTAVSDGYTTVYAHHEESGLFAMAIIYVHSEKATPQIETGNGFTVILKANGTVWTLGNGANGKLGNGTTQNSNKPVQVKIDEDTNLESVIKIVTGDDHALALTREGKIYAWGLNTYGQLGQNNTEESSYAKLVLSESGTGYLSNIVDISAGTSGSVALDKNGNVYVWGDGQYGAMGNNTTTTSYIPVKTTIKNAIKVSMEQVGGVRVLTSDGVVWAWGRNPYGELGINCTKNTSYPMKTALDTTEITTGAAFTTIKKTDDKLYTTGKNTDGRSGTASTTDVLKYTLVSLPSTVTSSNKVKYVKGGRMNTTILLQDGTIWSVGRNTNGELGNGTTTDSTTFVQGQTINGTLQNVLIIGRNNGPTNVASLNTAVITKIGDIYTTGNNAYGQLGDGSTDKSLYYKKIGKNPSLCYEDETIELQANEKYQIDIQKLYYKYNSFNVFNDENYKITDLKYTSSDKNIATVDSSGIITAQNIKTGTVKIKIEDITNGFETYIKVIINKLQDTDTIMYIYDADDMVRFRDNVNAGDNYAGKTVYVMANIDMSSVCSKELGSFIPIGTSETNFAGTFDGNYHKISNLYMNSNEYVSLGLFTETAKTGIIQNVIMENINIYSDYNVITHYKNAGGIVGYNRGTIQNCGINSGNIKNEKTSVNTTTNLWPGARTAGIAGGNSGTILNCYNKASIISISPSKNSWNEAFAGGIVGYGDGGQIINCYNTGTIKSTAYAAYSGGIAGGTEKTYSTNCTKNSYNIGKIITNGKNYNYCGGVIGRSGWRSSNPSTTIENVYCTTDTAKTYYYYNSSLSSSTKGRVEVETLKTYSTKLGSAFEDDNYNINGSYPILWWEVPQIELNKKQEYIKVGEKLQLNIVQNQIVSNIVGGILENNNLIWKSTNEDIATVDNNGLVTGVSDGYTTIYAHHEATGLFAMAIINVASQKATPQIETGEGFTAILKADGTVWTLGNNSNGALGDGTNENRTEAVQVKIDENTNLENVIKISVGSNHILALTEDRKVYSWGQNSYGQLGHNNTDATNYAQPVLGEGGFETLNDIVDISSGNYGSMAVNYFGYVYVWGNGTYGELGNGTTTTSLIPVKSAMNNAISVSNGAGHSTALSQGGNLYTWGRNTYGELGIGNTSNNKSVGKVANQVTEISANSYESVYKDISGNVYAVGANGGGQLGNGTTTHANKFTKANLPTTVTGDVKVKYIKAGKTTTTIMLSNGTVYSVGHNTNGELGNGTTNNSSTFIQANTSEGTLENNIMIGRSTGENRSLNIPVINNTGRIYISGNNKYGQLGDNSFDSSAYFNVMGYKLINYPEVIKLHVGENKTLEQKDLSYVEKYFNVYNEDKTERSLLNKGNILNDKVATYSDGSLSGVKIGKTTLIVNDDETNSKLYIPVKVISENGTVLEDIQTGDKFTIALKANGTVWSFGANTKGELGLGDNVSKNTPNQVEKLKDIVVEQISTGNGHTIALTKDGKVYTWGLNTNGQLGNGTTKNSNIPQEITIPIVQESKAIVQEKIVKVVANKNTSYAITSTGKVYAWGAGFKISPSLLEMDKNILDITSTYYLSDDGIVRKIEDNTEIQLSYNETLPSQEPVIEAEKILQISEGTDHLLLLGESGIIYSYGVNTYGQLGDGTTVSKSENISTAVRLSKQDKVTDIVEVSAGDKYSIAVSQSGEIYLWGKNETGELGENWDVSSDGTQEHSYATKNEYLSDIVNISAGITHTAISNSQGEVYTFGNGDNGELGNGKNSDYYEPQLVGRNIVESNTNEILMEVDETTNIESKINYFNLYNDIATNLTTSSLDEQVVTVDAEGIVTALNEGRTTIVVKEDSSEKVGIIQVRVLAKGTTPPTNTLKIEPQTESGGSHTVMLKVDGSVWTYGQNEYGQLGIGSSQYSDVPMKVAFPKNTVITKIATGEDHSLALDSEGNVWVWGRNQYYQLGNNSVEYLLTPTKITEIKGIKDIDCGTYNSFAVTNTGEVYSWGLNANGECGVGNYTGKILITKAKYLTDVIDIKAGKNHTIVLKSTGEVLVAGSNLYGELGNSTYEPRRQYLFKKVEDLKNIVAIGTGNSNNLALDTSSNVYTWGSNIYGELGTGSADSSTPTPTIVPGVSNIRYLKGGKNTSILLDNIGNTYVTGLNKLGSLGNNTKQNISTFEKLDTISNVIYTSLGNTYTTYLKQDGTVYASGDYNHGDTTFKSRTTGIVPIQVGNDQTGFNKNEILVKINGTENILAYFENEFNLISLDSDIQDKLSYESQNTNIATVTDGKVTGVKTGTTWVKVTNTTNNKVYAIKVNVVESKYTVSPKVDAGENFAAVLKGDGTIYTYGYNSNGQLSDGTNITRDIPTATNIISTYKDLSAGEKFFIALRGDKTVWTSGDNTYGQLGHGSTKASKALYQVNKLTDIEKAVAGKNHVVALDSYGIVYGWGSNSQGQIGTENKGENILTPRKIGTINERIINVSAGEDQTVLIAANGKVYGMGSILNGYLEGLDNAVQVKVGKGYLLILTTDNTIYKYNGSTLTQVEGVTDAIDISVKNNVNMYQSIDEKTYTWGENTYGQLGDNKTQNAELPKQVLEHGENTYSIGAGYNNTYIIENTGSVYASGNNEYGSIGNSTRNNTKVHTLVGNRIFDIEPKTKIMLVNDTETVQIKSDTFNVFEQGKKDANEYTWNSDDAEVVGVQNGVLTAKKVGTANILVTDTITNEQITITRYVQENEKDRIQEISIDNIQATPAGYDTTETDVMKYSVKVETEELTGALTIKAKDQTDKISLDKDNWEENVGTGSLTVNVELPTKTTQIPIYIKTTNGTIIKYLLDVEKISSDVKIKKITVTSGADLSNPDKIVEATPINATRYEVVVSENTQLSLTQVTTNSDYSSVSIDGKQYELNTQNKQILLGTNIPKEVKIVVKAENGKEQEYTLVIYKENELSNLEKLVVNDDKEAIKISEGKYAVTVENNIDICKVYAKAISSLVDVSIENNTYNKLENTNIIKYESNPQEVSIKLKLPNDEIKEYTLEIYKKTSNLLDMVIVGGNVIMQKEDGTYEAYLPSSESTTIKAIAKENTSTVQIDENEARTGETSLDITTLADTNTFKIKVTTADNYTEEYTLVIKDPKANATLEKIYVENENYKKDATRKEDGTYEVKVPNTYTEFDVTAIAQWVNAKVKIAEGQYTDSKSTEKVILSEESDTTTVTISVKSEDGQKEITYTLNIIKVIGDTTLNKITLYNNEDDSLNDNNGIQAVWDEEKKAYVASLTQALKDVYVKAEATSTKSQVRIDSIGNGTNIYTRNVTIDSKETLVPITVEGEDGTRKKYDLIITGLPDNTNVNKVVVTTKEGIAKQATKKEGENVYEVRLNSSEYTVELTPEDILSKVKLGDENEVVGIATTMVTKTENETIVKAIVTSQNGLEKEEYTIIIKEHSTNASIGKVTINKDTEKEKIATITQDGNYTVAIPESEQLTKITVETNDEYATVYLDGTTENANNITVEKQITQRTTTYKIKVIAEDGVTFEEHDLIITKVSDNTTLDEVKVTTTVQVQNEETGEVISNEVSNVATLKEDGSYYLKIPREDNSKVKITAQNDNANVSINNSDYVQKTNEAQVDTILEKTTVTLSVRAEDGTIKNYPLILEKMSNDTQIKIESEEMLKLDGYTVYVDETLNDVDLKITTNNEFGKIRLKGETNYTEHQIIRTVDLSTAKQVVLDENSGQKGWLVNVEVQAEDGTLEEHTITIVKTGNVNITNVQVKDETIQNNNDEYKARINVANSTKVKITTDNENAKIQIIKETDNNGTITESIIATGTGELTKEDLSIANNPENYIIRITSAGGTVTKDYDLVIEQKSTNTEVSYIKVDGNNAIQQEGKYIETVSGKEEYPVVIKPKEEKAYVKIAYGKVIAEDGTVTYTNEGEFHKGTLNENVPVADGESLEVQVTVKSENEAEEQVYTLIITRISSNIKKITVEDLVSKEVTDEGTGEVSTVTEKQPVEVTNYNQTTKTYTIIVNKELDVSNIVVEATSSISKITLDNDPEAQGIATINKTLKGKGTTTVKIKVVSADGQEETRYLNIIQLSDEIGLETITVDGVTATKDAETGNYEVTVSNKQDPGTIYAKTISGTSKVSINNNEAKVLENTTQVNKGTETQILVPVKVIAEDGTEFTYTLTINILSNDSSVKHIKVTQKIPEQPDQIKNAQKVEGEENSYVAYIYDVTPEVTIDLGANNENTTIQQVAVDEDGKVTVIKEQKGQLVIDINTPVESTQVQFRTIAEDGEMSEIQTLTIQKLSTDATIKEIYVNGTKIEKNEEGNYVAQILDTAGDPTVKAITNSDLAHVRIGLKEEHLSTAEEKVTLSSEKETIVPITVRSQAGTTEVVNVYIQVVATSNELDIVTVDNKEKTSYNEETHTYQFIVDPEKENYELLLTTISNYAKITYEGVDYGATLRQNISMAKELEGKELKVTVTSENNNSQKYTILLIRESNNTEVEYLKVDNKTYELGADKTTYTAMIGKLQENVDIEVKTKYQYATIKLGDLAAVRNKEKATIKCDLSQDKIIVPIIVTAPDGTTTKTYNVILTRGNNDTSLTMLKVNNQEVTADEDGIYRVKVEGSMPKANVDITAHEKATITLADASNKGTLNTDVTLTKPENIFTIKVVSEDGTEKEYTLKITRQTNIAGKIITENAEGKHKSLITVYKTSDTRKENEKINTGKEEINTGKGIENEREVVKQIETKEDGTFVIEVDDIEKYDVLVTKAGYLDYRVIEIEVTKGEKVTLDDYNLIAGDVVKTGEIEIDDLVRIGDNYGAVTEENANKKGKYDLNGDAKIDKADRNILKKNYGKKAETIEWVNPNPIPVALMAQSSKTKTRTKVNEDNDEGDEETSEERNVEADLNNNLSTTSEQTEQDLVLPLKTKYKITSPYGMRKHPTTGEYKKHTGIDLVGEHHGNIIAVADGEVVFSGVNTAFGNCIEIKHTYKGKTIYSFYAHLSRRDVKVGYKVIQGQVIGLEGGASTDENHGWSTGHHLHFEIRKASGYGNDVDPNEYFDF